MDWIGDSSSPDQSSDSRTACDISTHCMEADVVSIDDGLRSLFVKNMQDADSVSVETGLTALGVPDLNMCMLGQDVWVEMKATSGWSVTLRPEQIAWAERRIRHGGAVFLAVRRRHEGGPRKGGPEDQLWVYWGGQTRQVSDLGLKDGPPPLLMESGGPMKWRWDMVSALLFSPRRASARR